MKLSLYFSAFILIIFLAGCSGPKIIAPALSKKAIAEKAIADADYTKAVEAWKNYLSEQTAAEIPGEDYAVAAQTAYKTGDTNLAVNWFERARYKNYADAEMYLTLAKIYRSQQNISKELNALEYYKANFTGNLNEVNQRLFEIYNEIKMPDQAMKAWAKMNESSKNDITNLKSYFKINQQNENALVCDSLATVILEKEPENVEALEWMGDKYYWLAENRYQQVMEKYNSNKTNKQYKILLGELDLVTADFKKALPYLEKLWKIEPGEKYASYLANIYARFGDETKMNYYRKYMK